MMMENSVAQQQCEARKEEMLKQQDAGSHWLRRFSVIIN